MKQLHDMVRSTDWRQLPKTFVADLSTDIVARLAVQQAEATYNIKAWPVKMIGDNWEQVPTFGNLWQLFKKRALFGFRHSISELADRFLKCSLGKCIEIWGVDTLCGSQLTKRRPFWWSFSWEQSFPPGSASTLFLLGSWSIQEGNRWWVWGGESAVAFCG